MIRLATAPTELVTAVQEDLEITVVVLVNGGCRSIEALQRSGLGIRFGSAFEAEHARGAAGQRWHG